MKKEREKMISIGCHLLASGGYNAMVKTALSINASTFAFFTRNPRGSRVGEEDSNDAITAECMLRDNDIGPLVAHGAYTMNLCTADPDARSFASGILAGDLRRVAVIPGNYYNFYPGSHVGQGANVEIDYISDALKMAMKPDYPVMVLLETMAGKGSEIGGRFEELKAIIDAVGRSDLGVCMDTCHVHDAGYDIVNDMEGVLSEFDWVIGLDRLKALHLNDSLNPAGSHKDRHARLGEGYIGLEFFESVVKHPFLSKLPMILETPNELPGYAREISILRQKALTKN